MYRLLDLALAREPVDAGRDPADHESDAIPASGQPFGDYLLLEEIGRGGAGVVYCAWQPRLQRKVALKMLSTVRLETRDARDRFRREAELTASLDHPNILPIHEVGEQDGAPYYTSRLAVGGNLASRIDAYRGQHRDIARLVATLARAVAHAHAHGVLHRDLKPSNVVFDGAGQCLIADFGLARRLAVDSSLTGMDALIGTPRYVAPEVVTTAGAQLTAAVDVYGLGAILYELLTGQAPFADLAPLQLLRQIATRRPAPPRLLDAAIPARLETICLRCLEKRPTDRFASAGVLAEALDQWTRKASRRTRGWRRLLWPGTLPSKRRAWAWRTMVALAICAVAATLALAQHGTFSSTPDPHDAARRVAVLPVHLPRPPAEELAATRALATALHERRVTGLIGFNGERRLGRVGVLPPSALARAARRGALLNVQVSVSTATPDSTVRVTLIDALRGERLWQGEARPGEIDTLAQHLAPVLIARQRTPPREATLPRTALAAVVRGDELYSRFENGANDAAIEAYQHAIAIAPNFALAHARLSVAYAQRSNRFGGAAFWNDSAIEEAERAARLDPTLAAASAALGFAYYNKGWWQRSTLAYEHAKALGLVGFETSLALNYYGVGRYDRAFQLYRQSSESTPGNGLTAYLAAQTLFTLGATDIGERWMRAAIANESHAGKRQLMEAEIARYRGDYARCRTLAGTLARDLVSGGFGSAGDITRICAERQHDWPAALAMLEDDKRQYAQGTGDLGNAGPALEEAVLLQQLGRNGQAAKVLAAARQSAQAGIDSGREYPKIWLRMAAVLRMQGDTDGAYRMLDAAFAHGLTINARNEDDFEFLPFLADARFVALRDASRANVDAMRARVAATLLADAAPSITTD